MSTPRYLLIGGSNCVIKGGFGARLQETLGGNWVNRSLGNSPSLRGVEFLLGNPGIWDEFDQVFFEYTLNDLIFEGAQTLDPQSHLNWLRAMLGIDSLRAKLILVLLNGQGACRRVDANNSFVLENYRRVMQEFPVRSIDLLQLIAREVSQQGASAVFKDNDHFSDAMVAKLVSHSLQQFAQRPVEVPAPESVRELPRLKTLDPLCGQRRHVRVQDFKTALISTQLANLEQGSELVIPSPGGTLVGLYAIASREAGCVCISTNTRSLVKSFRHQFNVEKPFLAMRQLTVPINTYPNEPIRIRFAKNAYAVPGAVLDNTMAQVINHDGASVQIGSLVFLQHGAIAAQSHFSGLKKKKIRSLLRIFS